MTKSMKLSNPGAEYRQQRGNAKRRSIDFLLTYEQWCKIWEDSWKYALRGRGPDDFVMGRINDEGPYEVGNVEIISSMATFHAALVRFACPAILSSEFHDARGPAVMARRA